MSSSWRHSCEEYDGELYVVLLNYNLVWVAIRSTRTYNSSYVVYKNCVCYATYTTEKVLHWKCTSKSHCKWMCDSEKMILFQSQEQCVNTGWGWPENLEWWKHKLSCETSVHKSARFVLLQEYFLWGWYSWYSDWQRVGLIPCAGKRFFSAPNRSDWLWVPHSLLFSGYWVLLPAPACRAPIKNEWCYTSALPYVFMTRTGTTSTSCLWGLLWIGEILTWPYLNL